MDNSLIKRQDAIDLVRDVCDAIMSGCDSHYDPETGDEVYNDILEVDAILKCNKEIRIALVNLPSAESERKKGKWIWDNKMPFERCRCSECGYYRQLKCPEPDNYCPNCGSDMREEKHVND